MGSANLVRAETTPFRIEPQRGQIPENAVESPNREVNGVLHEHEMWSHLANDSCHFPPEAGVFAFESGPVACG
jgi:hypothetical protein